MRAQLPVEDHQQLRPPPDAQKGATPTPGATPGVTLPTDSNSTGSSGGTRTAAGATGRKTSKTAKKNGRATATTVVGQGDPAATGDEALIVARGPITAPKPQDPLPLLLYIVAAAVAVLGIFAPPAVKFTLDRRRAPGSPKRTQ